MEKRTGFSYIHEFIWDRVVYLWHKAVVMFMTGRKHEYLMLNFLYQCVNIVIGMSILKPGCSFNIGTKVLIILNHNVNTKAIKQIIKVLCEISMYIF